jgi:hypothetical protein
MKKSLKKLLVIALFIICTNLAAQPGGPPDPPDGHGNTGDQNPGGNASLRDGLLVLTGLAMIYAGRKSITRNDTGKS